MPKWLKVVLVVLGVMVALTGLCIGGSVYWFNANKGDLMEMGKKSKADGEAFGAKSNDVGCVGEALARLDKGEGLMAEVGIKLFLVACLEKAAPTDGFCTDVPAKGEIMATATWASAYCIDLHAKDPQACGRLVQAAQEHCGKTAR